MSRSYGSTVAGVTARDHGLAADSTVFAGSPCVRSEHARELGLPAGSVFATRADNDIIQHGYDHTDLFEPVRSPLPTRIPAVVVNTDPDLIHGNDPTDADFGARRFGSDPGTPMSDGLTAAHSEYWEEDSQSLDNFGFIVAVRDDLVTPS